MRDGCAPSVRRAATHRSARGSALRVAPARSRPRPKPPAAAGRGAPPRTDTLAPLSARSLSRATRDAFLQFIVDDGGQLLDGTLAAHESAVDETDRSRTQAEFARRLKIGAHGVLRLARIQAIVEH